MKFLLDKIFMYIPSVISTKLSMNQIRSHIESIVMINPYAASSISANLYSDPFFNKYGGHL